MESDNEQDEMIEGRPAFRRLMMHRILHGRKEIDPRTVAALQANGLLGDVSPPLMEPHLLAALSDVRHTDRAGSLVGPLLFVSEGPKSRVILDVKDFLVHPDRATRLASSAHFQRLVARGIECVTPRSAAVYGNVSSHLQEADERIWRPAGLKLFDAISTDFVCATRAVAQCVEMECTDEQLRPYLSGSLWPSVEMFDSIQLKCIAPSSTHEELSKEIDILVQNAGSLTELVQRYVDLCGIVPLAPPLSMSHAVRQAATRRGWGEDAWRSVWSWAKGQRSRLAYYHALQVFCRVPELIPQGCDSEFWNEVAAFLEVPDKNGGEASPPDRLALRCDLARHFCHWSELQLPGRDGEKIAVMSWWMAETVATAIEPSDSLVRKIMQDAVNPREGLAGQMWELAHPPIAPHALRYATLFRRSLWTTSLIAELKAPLAALIPKEHHAATLKRIGYALVGDILACAPQDGESTTTYAFELGSQPTAEAFIRCLGSDDSGPELLATAKRAEQLRDAKSLLDALHDLPNADGANATVTALAFRAAAFSGSLQADAFWEKLNDREWRNRLLKVGMPSIQAIYEGFAELQVQADLARSVLLPHYYAIACAEASDDSQRELLFAFALASSVASQNFSAIRRLLSGQQRNHNHERARRWCEHLRLMQLQASPWLACRLRATIAALDE